MQQQFAYAAVKGASAFLKPFNCVSKNRMWPLHHTTVNARILELSVYGGHCLCVNEHGKEKKEPER